MKPPEEIARSIFDAYNAMDDDTTHMTLNAKEAHELALAFCGTVRRLELVNQMLVNHERESVAERTNIENHMRQVALYIDHNNDELKNYENNSTI